MAVGPPPRLCVLGADGDPGALRLGRLLSAPVFTRGRSVVRERPEIVVVRLTADGLGRAALITTLAGVSAAIAAPIGPAAPLPWWGRRYHRFLLPDQATARAWGESGVALGRLVVVGAEDDADEVVALRSVLDEVRAMSSGPDIRPRAR